jgi:hypothetical protein
MDALSQQLRQHLSLANVPGRRLSSGISFSDVYNNCSCHTKRELLVAAF